MSDVNGPDSTHESWWLYHLSICACISPPKHSSVYSNVDNTKEQPGSNISEGRGKVIRLSNKIKGSTGRSCDQGCVLVCLNVCQLAGCSGKGYERSTEASPLRLQGELRTWQQAAASRARAQSGGASQGWPTSDLGRLIQTAKKRHMWKPYVGGERAGCGGPCQSSSVRWGTSANVFNHKAYRRAARPHCLVRERVSACVRTPVERADAQWYVPYQTATRDHKIRWPFPPVRLQFIWFRSLSNTLSPLSGACRQTLSQERMLKHGASPEPNLCSPRKDPSSAARYNKCCGKPSYPV